MTDKPVPYIVLFANMDRWKVERQEFEGRLIDVRRSLVRAMRTGLLPLAIHRGRTLIWHCNRGIARDLRQLCKHPAKPAESAG